MAGALAGTSACLYKMEKRVGEEHGCADRSGGGIEVVDVAVMDAQYDALEYRDHVGWGHGCVDDVVRIAVAGEVQRLFLFHHDPDHDDARVDQMVLRARELVRALGSDLVVGAAKEGLTVPIAPRLAEC